MLVVIEAKTTQEIQDCLSIREKVFIEEQGVSPEIERDAFDQTAYHFLALKDGLPVGTARVLVSEEEKNAVIGRVSVLKVLRGAGIGRALMEAIVEAPSLRAVRTFSLHAQTHALRFYEKLGYAPEGDEYMEAGIPHRNMKREAPAALASKRQLG